MQNEHTIGEKKRTSMKNSAVLKLKLSRIDENYVMLEAIDRELLSQVTRLVKQLKGIDFGVMPTFSSARDAAIQDATAALAGTSKAGFVRKILSLFKNKENPLTDVVAFADAIKNFFAAMNSFIEAHKVDRNGNEIDYQGNNKDWSSVQELIAGDSNEATKNLQKIVKDALKPDSRISRISKNWLTKYLKNGVDGIVRDVMNADVSAFQQTAMNVKNSLKNSQDAVSAVTAASNTTGGSTTPSAQTAPTNGTEQPQATAQATSPEETQNQPATKASSVTRQDIDTMSSEVKMILKKVNLDKSITDAQVELIIKVLDKRGFLK